MLGAAGAEETRVEVGPAARSGTAAAACHPGSLRKNANTRQGRRHSSSVHIFIRRVQGCRMYRSIVEGFRVNA